MENKTISIAQYAKAKGITKQAVYKQLNGKLKEFLIVSENGKRLSVKALTEEELARLNEVEQPVEQLLNNQIQPILTAQIEEKDRLIHSLLEQITALQEQNGRLTEQNGKLADLLQGNQILLAQEKKEKLLLEEEATTRKEKRGFFSIFKRKKNNT